MLRVRCTGNIEFSAEFFPCAHLRDVSFSPPEASKLVEVDEDEEEASIIDGGRPSIALSDATSAAGGFSTPTSTTFAGAGAASPPTSPRSIVTTNGGNGNGKEKTEKEKDDEGIVISKEELLRTQTGVLAFQVISGQLAKKGARLEVRSPSSLPHPEESADGGKIAGPSRRRLLADLLD
jgi:hypothetical protein